MTRTNSRRPRRALLAVAALTTVAASASVLTPAGAATRPNVTITRTPILSQNVTTTNTTSAVGLLRPWSVHHMGGPKTVTLAQALEEAKAFDVIAGHEGTFKPYVAAMKQANPKLTLHVYMNGTFDWRTDLPESYYSHDAMGRRIYAKGWSSTFLMNVSNSGYLAYAAQRAKSTVAASGYDGMFLDVLGPAPLDASYVSALPVNPATGTVWTRADWLRATTNVARTVQTALGTRPIIGNGLAWGSSYSAPEAPTAQLMDSGMIGGTPEAFVRGATAGATAYRNETAWKADVDMLTDLAARGRRAYTVTKVWATMTAAQKQAWYVYTAATFLLGTDGQSYLSFSFDETDAYRPHSLDHLNLGAALGNYYKAGGVYQREFVSGRVMVNPTKLAATVTLPATMRTLTGSTVTTVTVAPQSAVILTR